MMNFFTQFGEATHPHNPPVSFHLKRDHFHLQNHGHSHSSDNDQVHPNQSPRLRRHTLIGTGHPDTLRPSSMLHLDAIKLKTLSSNQRAYSANLLSVPMSTSNHVNSSRFRSHSRVDDESLEQLLDDPERLQSSASLKGGLGEAGQPSEYLTPPCTEELPSDHDCQLEGCQRAIINVSGLRFETQLRTLDRLPHTLLGDPDKRRKYWDESRQEFFFDRHRPTFQAVLYYYQSGGRLKRPLEVPMDIFLSELNFYELSGSAIDSFKVNEGYIVESSQPEGPKNRTMNKIWTAVEFPESSVTAKVFAFFSVFFILVSVVTFCIETLPSMKSLGCTEFTKLDHHTGRNVTVKRANFLDPLFICESCCITWFVMELVLRLIVSPSKLVFFKATINWIDLIAIAPYFIFLALSVVNGTCSNGHKSSFLSVLRVLRVVRILKLSKHSEGLKILGMTLKTSIRELSMFVLFLGIATVIFSGAIFYAEIDQPDSQFTSIPDAFWWAIVSMTTVGYGDFVPKGVLGKLLGGVCVLSGVLAIALPVPVIVANFNNYYRHYTGRDY